MIKLHTFAMTALLATASAALAQERAATAPPAAQPDEVSRIPALPHTPAAVTSLISAQPFTLEQGYAFEWRADHPQVRSGWLLVLAVNTDLVFPRQTQEPILYVGKTTAERINIGHESGRVVVVVPSDLNDKGEVSLDLSQALMWFGTPGLPEQVDAGRIEAEHVWATNAKIAPLPAETIAAAREKGGDMLHAANREALRLAAARLIQTYSPQEADLVATIETDAAAAADRPAAKGD